MIAAALAAAGLVAAAAVVLAASGGERTPTFAADVQPIFDAKCVSCHPVSYPYLDLRPGRSYQDLYRVSAETKPAFARVVPGLPELSYLLVHPPDPSLEGLLSAEDREVISAWIRAGAKND